MLTINCDELLLLLVQLLGMTGLLLLRMRLLALNLLLVKQLPRRPALLLLLATQLLGIAN